MRKIALALSAAGLALGLAAAAPAAAQPVAPKTISAPQAKVAAVCTVNDNGVNFRGGPGSQYPVLGKVNKGQNMNRRGNTGDWIMGDLWGGPTGVWIYTAYLDC
ncbi:SH3 domain-containing protein [Streptomyces celluloflavus]|uniref:SH3 domain-containing protein n=1 Tax=Streptomyces celluloflavus TaxID=58344 RepID=UPI0036531FC5